MKTTVISGTVVPFQGNGRKFNYPTANIRANTSLKDGVYFGFADLAGHTNHPALIFIGAPITIGEKERRVEAHLLDIEDKDYYDLPLKLVVHKFHRENQNFASVDDLLKAMKDDETTARAWFKEAKDWSSTLDK